MPAIVRASSMREFARSPVERYLVGAGWLSFCESPSLWGFAVWGRADAHAMAGLLPALALELETRVAPHASVVDASRLTSADAASFEALGRYVEAHHEALARQVTRLAIVHPTGFQGAVVSGFFNVLAPPYPVALAPTLDAALLALDVREPARVRALARLIDDASGTAPLIGTLRAALARKPALSLVQAARLLHVPPRTLQRRLDELGTSFSAVAADVRLQRALERITTTAEALTAVALDVGFASSQHMSRAIKSATGKTPSQLRAGH